MTRLADLARALAPARPVRVVDVGANPLDAPPYARMIDAGCAEVIGFEPQYDAYSALVRDAPANARFINAAVGAGGRGMLHHYPCATGMTSLYALREGATRYLGRFGGLATETVEVETEALDDLDDVPSIDLLKVDVQGAERDVLRGGRAKLADAVAVITEMRFYPLYEGEPSMGDLDAELRAQGFVLHRFLAPSRTMLPSRHAGRLAREARSQLIDGDAVYIRPLEDLAAWDDEALIRLALCAEGAFRSHDLCLMLLDVLENRGRIGPEIAERYVESLPKIARAPISQGETERTHA